MDEHGVIENNTDEPRITWMKQWGPQPGVMKNNMDDVR